MLIGTGLWVSEPCNPAPHQVLWQQESPCVSGRGGPYCKQSKKRKGRVVVPTGCASNPGLNLSGALCKNPEFGIRWSDIFAIYPGERDQANRQADPDSKQDHS